MAISFEQGGLSSLQKDRFSFFIFIFCIATILIQIILIAVSFGRLPGEVPIFYSRPWGEDMLGGPIFLLILPFSAFIALFLNFVMFRLFAKDDIFLERVLSIFTLTVNVMAFWGLFKILSLLT